jgi:hypothetical protein
VNVLIWNIQNFTLTRVNNALNPAGAAANLGYITRTVNDTQPDLFVVIEPLCNPRTRGMLATGDGVLALETVLAALRPPGDPRDWRLVPPLVVNELAFEAGERRRGRSETVGIFWRNQTLDFTGPWVWPAAAPATGPPVAPGAGVVPANYPAGIDNVLVPAGTQAAPAYTWHDNDFNVSFEFPETDDRRPLAATFRERVGGRTITVLPFHPSPRIANIGLSRLASLVLQEYAPAGNALTLAAGDMNVDLRNLSAMHADVVNNHFAGYQRLNPGGGVGNPTMLRRASSPSRTPAALAELAVPARYTKNECLDYGFVAYGGAAAPPAGGPRAIVVDRVAGAAAAAPFPVLTGEMASPLANFFPPHPLSAARTRDDIFRSPPNFGHMTTPTDGVSDHLPVLIVV